MSSITCSVGTVTLSILSAADPFTTSVGPTFSVFDDFAALDGPVPDYEWHNAFRPRAQSPGYGKSHIPRLELLRLRCPGQPIQSRRHKRKRWLQSLRSEA